MQSISSFGFQAEAVRESDTYILYTEGWGKRQEKRYLLCSEL